ncbi:sphingoid long chain base kinase-like protein [Xylariaceae sp. FL0594]|nr:sphingoid long chain base kinase-like protein [Xylariaceae sp. FL0594]
MSQSGPTPPNADALLSSILALTRGISLNLTPEALIVKDSRAAKRHRTKLCGFGVIGSTPSEIVIPYYNILWASADPQRGLIIDYAHEVSKTKLRPLRLRYPLGEVAPAIAETWARTALQRAYGAVELVERGQRAKVIINPHAGPGKGLLMWQADVHPLFLAAKWELEVIITGAGGQAMEIVRTMDIDNFDVVIVCSGDGLAYEVFNGLGKRPDARAALRKIAVAHIPSGSGNAMSLNLNGSPYGSHAALAVIKGQRTPMDLMSLTYGSERILSFLSQSVGIIAECDLGTESMRWMGATRFDVGVVQRIFTKRVYPCDVAYKVELDDKNQIKSHYKRHQNGEAESPEPELVSAAEENVGENVGEGLPPLRFGTVNDELPEDWEKHSYDKMGSFYCGNMAWMAPDANFFPAALINDGMMDVAVNDGDLPATKYASLMMSVSGAKFFDNPALAYRKVAAYRFTPRDQADGYISIDGERIPFGPFQVEVHPGLGTVMSKNGRYEAFGPPGWEQAK